MESLEQFQALDLFPVTIADLIVNLLVALISGMIIGWVYKLVYKGNSYSATFVNSLVLLTMITSIVIMVIGNNLARAFGLVGAMSIIRFRTAVRDVQDIVFIFLSLSIGMATGVGLHLVAFGGTIIISIVIILLTTLHYGAPPRINHLLQVVFDNRVLAESEIRRSLEPYANRISMVNVKGLPGNKSEVFYRIKIRRKANGPEIINNLQQISGIDQVNIYFDSDDSDAV
ncbi:MAG: DUF4956 domain-containing protein [Bacteroidales bacterium]